MLNHVQELSEAGVPGMDVVAFSFPGKVRVKGFQLQIPFHGSLIAQCRGSTNTAAVCAWMGASIRMVLLVFPLCGCGMGRDAEHWLEVDIKDEIKTVCRLRAKLMA